MKTGNEIKKKFGNEYCDKRWRVWIDIPNGGSWAIAGFDKRRDAEKNRDAIKEWSGFNTYICRVRRLTNARIFFLRIYDVLCGSYSHH